MNLVKKNFNNFIGSGMIAPLAPFRIRTGAVRYRKSDFKKLVLRIINSF